MLKLIEEKLGNNVFIYNSAKLTILNNLNKTRQNAGLLSPNYDRFIYLLDFNEDVDAASGTIVIAGKTRLTNLLKLDISVMKPYFCKQQSYCFMYRKPLRRCLKQSLPNFENPEDR